MSFNKILLIFLFIVFLAGGIIYFQFVNANTPKSSVTIANKTFAVFVMQKPLDLQKGLSGRSALPENQGMLFLFPAKGDQPFWMKDMKFAIDMIFISDDKIVSITHNAPAPPEGTPNANLEIYRASAPINKVLEINAGLAKKYNFKPGDSVKIDIKQ